IEDKINRFSDRERHQLFVEPEGWNTVEIYLNGFSTSLPEETQYEALRKIVGFENIKMFRPGYAIEYDYFPPTQLFHTLETKKVEGLYFAGQINGTTGYEEAACQGIMAGINAHLKINYKEAFVLKRSEAYIGVLIDDLVNKGTDEPYRMFTSRAEFRTLLRQDNADLRLTRASHQLGLASTERLLAVEEKEKGIQNIKSLLLNTTLEPEKTNQLLTAKEAHSVKEKTNAARLLLRPYVGLSDLLGLESILKEKLSLHPKETLEQAEIQIKYEAYIQKENDLVQKISLLEEIEIPGSFEFGKIPSLSAEAIQKFTKVRPKTLGQASRISGVNPSDVQILLVYMGR
ncbi:MAG: FAD-dependent oxidoreductase, partial [Chitinophagaceae bacterium]